MSAPKPCALRQDPWLRSNGKYEPDEFVENPRSDAACPPCGASGGHRGLSGCDGAGSAAIDQRRAWPASERSEEHTSELPSLMRTSYAVFCSRKKKNRIQYRNTS